MPRYFRDRPAGEVGTNYYYAVSDKTIKRPGVKFDPEKKDYVETDYEHNPIGSVTVKYSPREYIPNFTTVDRPRSLDAHAPLSRATGLSEQFLNHLAHTVDKRRDVAYDIDGETDPQDDELSDALWSHPMASNRGIEFARSVSTIKKHPEANPDTLFTEIDPELKVTEAFFDPSVNNLFPITASIIKQDYPNTKIVASGDLSEHSSKLAKRAAERGLISGGEDTNPGMEVTNTINFSPQTMLTSTVKYMEEGGKQIPQEDVSKAKQSLRNELRATRNRQVVRQPQTETKLSNQFDHPKLPGMEGY